MWSANMKPKKVASAPEQLMNPKGFGGFRSDGKEVDSKDDMFNAKGELNAYSVKDAMENIDKFGRLRSKYANKNQSPYTYEDKQRILSYAFETGPEERLKFGAEMVPLILERLDYQGFCRQIFYTHELAQGQINCYEKDINVAALVIQEDGYTVETQVKGDRVFPYEFLVTSMPQVTLSEVYQRQFDIIDRIHNKTLYQIMLKEDRAAMRELYQASTVENSPLYLTGALGKEALENLQLQVERHRLQVEKFIMNRQEFGDLKKAMNAMDFDPMTSRDFLLTGIFGSIWGIDIFVTAGVDERGLENVSVPPGVVFAVTGGRTLGVMPIRINLQVLPADQFVFGKPKYAWLFVEQISMAVLNPRSVAVAIKQTASVPAWLTD